MKKRISPKKFSILIFIFAVITSKVISKILFQVWIAQVVGWSLLVVILMLIYSKNSD
jgi:hypothetical protein